MLGSLVVYSGFTIAIAGALSVHSADAAPWDNKAFAWADRSRCRSGPGIIGLLSPAFESRVSHAETRLDEFTPRWQFREYHWIRVAAPPERVFEAIKE